ncbi:YXWGXW repeat-containing protein [Aeoliella mucimassa]|uniref:Uncharacterized protein n=1 Tax=Aeoliella mucimassa TaxID=2527972 RepID=A0A518ASR8_9BACT|nr:YXWGXW repeat-containing protein [Aeoliella mucimassa]QDU57779.1 hypothetical protein Pan181_40010 [Aeoliella mucimassa]
MSRLFSCVSRCTKSLMLVAACCSLPAATLVAQLPPPPTPDYSVQQNELSHQFTELSRGPIHEAFAQPFGGSQSSFVINRQPPAKVSEVPPSIGPQSREFQWIPGYWGWEPADERFVWVSGVWRLPPEGKVWKPGYWERVDGGYAWGSGYWSDGSDLLVLAEQPPEPREENPGAQPTPSHIWVPGCWQPGRERFEWRPGFWAQGYDGLVWMPMRYSWTPQGYVVVPGYWDYQLEDRGVLYTPVVMNENVTSSYRYSPTSVVMVDRLPVHLFINMNYGHYCFGNYYDYRMPRNNFVAWTTYNQGYYYDPLRMFYTTFHRDRFRQFQTRHDYYRDHRDMRPRNTWQAQRDWQRNGRVDLEDALLAAGSDILLNGRYFNRRRGYEFNNQPRRHEVLRVDRDRLLEAEKDRREELRDQEKSRNRDIRDYMEKREEYQKKLQQQEKEQVREPSKDRQDFIRQFSKNRDQQLRDINQQRQEQQRRTFQKMQDQQRDAIKRIQEQQREAVRKRQEQQRGSAKKQAEQPRPQAKPEMRRPDFRKPQQPNRQQSNRGQAEGNRGNRGNRGQANKAPSNRGPSNKGSSNRGASSNGSGKSRGKGKGKD